MSRGLAIGLAGAITLGLAAVPAGAQSYSTSYTFLQAVKKRDGNKATDMLQLPSSALVNTKDPGNGDAPLHIVARDRDLTWIAFLLSKGARIDQQNDAGETPLTIASQLGWAEGVELLLQQRAKVDLANDRGETPLILAVQRKDLPVVRLLLARGADPKKTDSVAGYSALDYAKQDRRAAAILKLLENPPVSQTARPVAGPKL